MVCQTKAKFLLKRKKMKNFKHLSRAFERTPEKNIYEKFDYAEF